jgi:uncharacterized protein YjiS (DUF1127 family)
MRQGSKQKANNERFWAEVVRVLARWAVRASQRRALAELEPARLEDLGISLAEMREECRKWFWEE